MSIPKDELARWKLDSVSIELTRMMQEGLDILMEAMASGQFLNLENMQETFGMTAKAAGEIDGINHYFEIIEGGIEDED